MSAYLIVNIGAEKPKILSEFLENMPNMIDRDSGKQVLSNGDLVQFNGLKYYGNYLVLEFDSFIHVKSFWKSNESKPLKLLSELPENHISFVQGLSSLGNLC